MLIKHRIPVLSPSARLISQGALFSLQVNYTEIGRQLAQLTNRSLEDKLELQKIALQKAKSYVLHLNLELAKTLNVNPNWAISYLDLAADYNFSIKSVHSKSE